MKKFSLYLSSVIVMAVCALALTPPVCQASPCPVSENVTLGLSTGSGVSTNTSDYFVKQLVYMQFTGGVSPTNVITVQRIHNAVTSTVSATTLSSGSATFYATNAPVYRFHGDVYTFSSSVSTGTTCEIIKLQLP